MTTLVCATVKPSDSVLLKYVQVFMNKKRLLCVSMVVSVEMSGMEFSVET